MSYPYMRIAFGLPVRTAKVKKLGSLTEVPLNKLFNLESIAQDTTLNDIEYEIFKYGFKDIGYTEYIDTSYFFGFDFNDFRPLLGSTYKEQFKNNLLTFDPDDIEILDPVESIARVQKVIAHLESEWILLLDKVKPTELLWNYITDDSGDRTPKLLKMTLSS